MRRLMCALAVLLTASTAQAGVISAGSWSALPVLTNGGSPFFDNTSNDGTLAAVGYQLPGTGWEYLSDNGNPVGFGFDGWLDGDTGMAAMDRVFSITDYPLGYLSYTGSAFAYTVPETGRGISSWQGTYMVLFRRVTGLLTEYRLGVEDLDMAAAAFDADFQDALFSASFTDVRPPTCVDCGGDTSVPEPAAIALFGIAAATFGRRLRRR